MIKDTINVVLPGLPHLGQEIEKYVKMGYTVADGYPSMYGWSYELQMHLHEEEVPLSEDEVKMLETVSQDATIQVVGDIINPEPKRAVGRPKQK